MQLRWVTSESGIIKTLQYQQHQWDGKNPGSGTPWIDVPTVKHESKGVVSMKWCEHIQWLDGRYRQTGIAVINDVKDVNPFQMFCEYCSAPRPRNKTLEEKLRQRLFGFSIDGVVIERDKRYPLIDSLAKIAEEHFSQSIH